MSSVDRIKEIKKEIIIVGGVGESLTGLLLGLGLYGKYFADGDAFHPLLNNMAIVWFMIVTGSLIAAWSGYPSNTFVLV